MKRLWQWLKRRMKPEPVKTLVYWELWQYDNDAQAYRRVGGEWREDTHRVNGEWKEDK
jgi:hypothetical protein